MLDLSQEKSSTADLVVDAVYEGIPRARMFDDPLPRLVHVSNQGGFRFRGRKSAPTLIALTSNFAEADWPDELDVATGRFVYYGDNREPGRDLHDTGRGGNHLLRVVFDLLHQGRRYLCPPILIFTALRTKRAHVFRGLAVPGFPGLPPTQDLVAIWKTVSGHRFQNYRAVFTVLDVPAVPRQWIDEAKTGLPGLSRAPRAWQQWVETGTYKPLQAPAAKTVRSRQEQLPQPGEDARLIECIRLYFAGRPTDFEACAGEIARLLLRDVLDLELTRPWRDGGRDAIGKLRLGQERASIAVTFALEAKCYTDRGVGVTEVSRLISRIRHREFGILVTTSYVDFQAYKEIVEDGHPVIIVSARDIVTLLREAGYATAEEVQTWLSALDPRRDVPGRGGA